MFNLENTASAYAKTAERILGCDSSFLEKNQEILPVFVELLFRSIETSLKHIGIESKLFTEKESRDRTLTDNGHGIIKIANLINSRLGSSNDYPVITALLAGINGERYSQVIRAMLFDPKFEPTRSAYANRNLGYLQIESGDLQYITDLKVWVDAVKAVSDNLSNSISVVSQWNASSSNSATFAVWYTKLKVIKRNF